jgi:hypothetical protein
MNNKKRKVKSVKTKLKPIKYSCCFTTYFQPGENPEKIVRATCAVVNLNTDEMVELIEALEDDDSDEFTERAVNLAVKYNCDISITDRPVPLEKCTACDCGSYLTDTIQSGDIVHMLKKSN